MTSSWKEIKRGCLQGSSLGPMLWNIYQNDLFYVQRDSHLSIYADDHQFKDPDQAVMVINNRTEDKRRDGTVRISWKETQASIKQ